MRKTDIQKSDNKELKKSSVYEKALNLSGIINAKDNKEIDGIINTIGISSGIDFINKDYTKLKDLAIKLQNDPDNDKIYKEFSLQFVKVHFANGVFDGSYVKSMVTDDQEKYIPRMRSKLVEEFDGKTASENLLIDIAISAYLKSLYYMQVYNGFLKVKNGSISFTQTSINMMKELSKASDIANRQFISALNTLRELKRPPVNIKVHSREAYVAQNQQFNKNA